MPGREYQHDIYSKESWAQAYASGGAASLLCTLPAVAAMAEQDTAPLLGLLVTWAFSVGVDRPLEIHTNHEKNRLRPTQQP